MSQVNGARKVKSNTAAGEEKVGSFFACLSFCSSHLGLANYYNSGVTR